MYLPTLTNRELAHHADVTFDALTATDLQVELAKRFDTLVAESEENAELLDFLFENDINDVSDARRIVEKAEALDERVNGIALLDVLREFDIDDPITLKKVLERDAKLTDVLDSLAQPMADLQALTTTA